MSPSLLSHLGSFAGRRILVIGEAMLDAYLHGVVERLSREAPVPVLTVTDTVDAPGGAANTAANIETLGGSAQLLSVIGDDREGERLRAALSGAGVDDHSLLVQPGRRTLAKQRLLAIGQMLVRFDTGSTESPTAALEDTLIERIEAAIPEADAVILSDYAYGVLTERVLSVVARSRTVAVAGGRERPLLVDARDLSRYRRLRPTMVKPNYAEAMRLLGEREASELRARVRQVGSGGERLLRATGARLVAVTVDTDGAFLFERGEPPYRTFARPRSHAKAAGAGDTFVAAFALALSGGATSPVALELAQAAAAVVVGKDGTSTCSAAELREYLAVGSKRLASRARLGERIDYHRRQGRRIVFTNGVFDILHRGHITYLNRAKALGDLLVVAVNSDASVKRLKGEARPINPLDDRLEVLEALSCVDIVVPFDEDTPEPLISIVRPDVYVKGGDYSMGTLPEVPLVESLGGTVQILPYVEDRSTTGVIRRVREAYAEEAR